MHQVRFLRVSLIPQLALAAIVLSVACVPAVHGQAKLHLLQSYPNALCLDGTPSGYYYYPASAAENTTKWIIHLQGGGECASEDRCKDATTNPLGSSKYWQDTTYLGWYNSIENNPDFGTWQHVVVGYCTQDLHSGQAAASPDTWGLYFSGRHVFTSVLADLEANYQFKDATEIILSGDSAGGIGVWYHLDYLAAAYPDARVVGAPVAGFYFFADPYTGVNHTKSVLAPFEEYAWPGHYKLWDAYVDVGCASSNSGREWFCMLSNNSYPYISTPVFITEAQTDQVVILYHDQVPPNGLSIPAVRTYMEEWHHNMSVALHPAESGKRDGVFNPACFIHTSFYFNKPLLSGLSFLETFGNWYYDRPGPKVLFDDCGITCNPTCPTSEQV